MQQVHFWWRECLKRNEIWKERIFYNLRISNKNQMNSKKSNMVQVYSSFGKSNMKLYWKSRSHDNVAL